MMQDPFVPNEREGIFRATTVPGLIVFFVFGMLFTGCQSSTPENPLMDAATDRAAIVDVLMRQQDAWNAGDIDAFMEDYVQSDTLRFTSGASVRYGWDGALERYYTTYPDRDAMGELTFDDLKVDVLSEEWALVFGSWHLKRGGAYEDIGGRYTLLMHREDTGWKVLYDHTSQGD